MQLWATTHKDNKIVENYTLDVTAKSRDDVENWSALIGDICHDLDLARPVILNKHYNELEHFSHTVFYAADFMEPVSFDKLRIEIIYEKKK